MLTPGRPVALHQATAYASAPRPPTTLTRRLLAGLEQEAQVQRDPNLKAERVVKVWNPLERQREELTGWRNDAPREKVKGQMRIAPRTNSRWSRSLSSRSSVEARNWALNPVMAPVFLL